MRYSISLFGAGAAMFLAAAAGAGGFGLTSGALSNVNDSMGTASLVYSAKQTTTYGSYCGPGWSDGAWVKSSSAESICTPGASLVAPKDGLDQLCKDHDKAYCGATAAQKDAADATLLAGLRSQKTEVNSKMALKGCSTVGSASLVASCSKFTGEAYSACVRGANSSEASAASSLLFGRSAAPAAASGAAKAVRSSAPGGNGITKLGGNGIMALPAPVEEETCADLSAKLNYIDAAITGFEAKREAYAKSIAPPPPPASPIYLCYNPWGGGYYYANACFVTIGRVAAPAMKESAQSETHPVPAPHTGVAEPFRW